jgi:hypothetical protein
MHLDLSDEQTAALLGTLDRMIDSDRYPLSPRIRTLKEIRAMIKPYPVREQLPATKHYEPIRETPLKSYTGPPMTLGNAAAAHVTLIVWCNRP